MTEGDFELIQHSIDYVAAEKHVRESNMIEGIMRDPTDEEIAEHMRFLMLKDVTVEDLQRFVYIYAGAGHRLRNLITDDHYIGQRHLAGGPHVLEKLQELIREINLDELDPWTAHVEYEVLHPFTDGNGRSGRMLWHWMMMDKYGHAGYHSRTAIGFLHRFYYQSMQYYSG